MRTHYLEQLDYTTYIPICIERKWERGDMTIPNWKGTTNKHEITCKRCLSIINKEESE